MIKQTNTLTLFIWCLGWLNVELFIDQAHLLIKTYYLTRILYNQYVYVLCSKIFQTPPTPGLATLQALASLLATVTEIMTLRHRK